jgi:hypothetical protein
MKSPCCQETIEPRKTPNTRTEISLSRGSRGSRSTPDPELEMQETDSITLALCSYWFLYWPWIVGVPLGLVAGIWLAAKLIF